MVRRRSKKRSVAPPLKWTAAPLPGSFMVLSLLGLIISAFYLFPLSYNWGIAFLILFVLMFVAALISMVESSAEIEWEMEKRHL